MIPDKAFFVDFLGNAGLQNWNVINVLQRKKAKYVFA